MHLALRTFRFSCLFVFLIGDVLILLTEFRSFSNFNFLDFGIGLPFDFDFEVEFSHFFLSEVSVFGSISEVISQLLFIVFESLICSVSDSIKRKKV